VIEAYLGRRHAAKLAARLAARLANGDA
jgi:hypothetical protein